MSIMKNYYLSLLSLIACYSFFCQSMIAQEDFQLEIESIDIYGLPSLHSYAHAHWDNKWLILGGQTSEDWEFSHANLEIYVVDPIENQIWTMPSEYLYDQVKSIEQLTSCFSQFYQEGNQLYMLGGYGYSPEIEGYYAFPHLTILNVEEVISHIIAQEYKIAATYFTQIEDDQFSVMDGLLTKIENTFYLIGGIEFYGFFDEEDPSYMKMPRKEVLSFKLHKQKGNQYTIESIGNIDYTAEFEELFSTSVPQIFKNEKEGFSIISNEEVDGEEYTSWMDVFKVGYSKSWQRNKKMPHYHSTIIPLYDKREKVMHTLFLNGCSDFSCSEDEVYGSLEKIDSLFIFSQSEKASIMKEKAIMPYTSYGKDAQFILNDNTPQYKNGVIKLHKLPKGKTHVGYIFGGSSTANPMINNDGSLIAISNSQLFKVSIIKQGEHL